MGNHHNKSFFGADTAILFDSGQLSSPAIFLTFIKKKKDGSWEKPSQKEGRAVKFSLVDIAFMLQVLRGDKIAWKTVHSYEKREISILLEQDSENRENVKVKAGNYLKVLNYGEVKVFKTLLEHTFQEKVIASTEVVKREEATELKKETIVTATEVAPELVIKPMLVETAILTGVIKGETEKALLIDFKGKKEIWVPKSAIVSNYDSKSTNFQEFEIDTWILRKNNLIDKTHSVSNA